MGTFIQIPSIILPQVWVTGLETELINDLITHPSTEGDVQYLEDKIIQITAVEVMLGVVVPGALWCWVELSPVPTTTSGAYWSAIGGGGGPLDPATGLPYIPPVAPAILVPVGVNGTVHTLLLPWVAYSVWARLVVQTPVAAGPAVGFWAVQAMISGSS